MDRIEDKNAEKGSKNTLGLVVTCEKLYLQLMRFCCDLSTFYRCKDNKEEKDRVKFPTKASVSSQQGFSKAEILRAANSCPTSWSKNE